MGRPDDRDNIEFVQLFYRDGSIIQPLQDKWSIPPMLSPAPSAKLKWEQKGGAGGGGYYD